MRRFMITATVIVEYEDRPTPPQAIEALTIELCRQLADGTVERDLEIVEEGS